MGFIKNIARKILQTEIEVYEKTIRDIQLDKISLENSKNREILRLTEEAKKALEEKCKVEKTKQNPTPILRFRQRTVWRD